MSASINQILRSCPTSGGGVHKWLFVSALKLHPHITDKAELARRLAEASAHCGRDVPAREIEEAIRDSQRCAEAPLPVVCPLPRWPGYNGEKVHAVVRSGPSLTELEALSPVPCADAGPRTEQIIDALFPGNPLLCAGPRKERALTRSRESWRGFLEHQQFIVPSPMSAEFGLTKEGHLGMRTLDNTGPRRFMVVEFDQGTFDQHAAVLAHLGTFAPLALVVHSGNKSLHGWFYCAGQPDVLVEKFFKYAVSLGADKATWTPCQFVRMPDGHRDNGKRQRVVFFNPKCLEAQ